MALAGGVLIWVGKLMIDVGHDVRTIGVLMKNGIL
jgi:hypothetical protein